MESPHPLRHLLPVGRHLREARRTCKFKRDGAWRDISSDEFRRAVEELSMGLRALGVEKGDRVGHPLREPARVGVRRPRHAGRGRGRRARSTRRSRPPQVLYILNDSEAKVLLRLDAAPGAEGRGDPRAGAAPPARDPHGGDAGRRGGGHALARRGARRRAAPRWPGRSRGGAQARRRGAAGRPGHAHLHLGHHRRAQGRDARRTATSCRTPSAAARSFADMRARATWRSRSCRSATSSSAWPATT